MKTLTKILFGAGLVIGGMIPLSYGMEKTEKVRKSVVYSLVGGAMIGCGIRKISDAEKYNQ